MPHTLFSRPSTSRPRTDAQLRWNDVESLPVHSALVGLVVLGVLGVLAWALNLDLDLLEGTGPMGVAPLVIGMGACAALARAWMVMYRADHPS